MKVHKQSPFTDQSSSGIHLFDRLLAWSQDVKIQCKWSSRMFFLLAITYAPTTNVILQMFHCTVFETRSMLAAGKSPS